MGNLFDNMTSQERNQARDLSVSFPSSEVSEPLTIHSLLLTMNGTKQLASLIKSIQSYCSFCGRSTSFKRITRAQLDRITFGCCRCKRTSVTVVSQDGVKMDSYTVLQDVYVSLYPDGHIGVSEIPEGEYVIMKLPLRIPVNDPDRMSLIVKKRAKVTKDSF